MTQQGGIRCTAQPCASSRPQNRSARVRSSPTSPAMQYWGKGARVVSMLNSLTIACSSDPSLCQLFIATQKSSRRHLSCHRLERQERQQQSAGQSKLVGHHEQLGEIPGSADCVDCCVGSKTATTCTQFNVFCSYNMMSRCIWLALLQS